MIKKIILLNFLLIICSNTQAKINILFLGDSLTAGLGVAKNQSYPYKFNEILIENNKKELNLNIIVDGISGSTSAGAPLRLEKKISQLANEGEKIDILFLALGANDGLRGYPPASIKESLALTIDIAINKRIDVVIAGMKMPDNYGALYVKSFESIYSELYLKYKKSPVEIYFYPFLLENIALNPELNQSDGIHPNASGHLIIAKNLVYFFNKENIILN